jgi:hypothetical protein
MKKVAIVQSSYIPWKGYFDMINMVDEFIFYDDMQYTRRDWRNRNRIQTSGGIKWLSIPVKVKGKYSQKINEAEISDKKWNIRHWKSIKHNYSRAKYFHYYRNFFEELFLGCNEKMLSHINYRFISSINRLLGITTALSWSNDYKVSGGKTERLINICKYIGATEYISGPAAKGYIDMGLFHAENIAITWMNYTNYPRYSQLFTPFEHQVSIIDLIFNEGPNLKKYMMSLK